VKAGQALATLEMETQIAQREEYKSRLNQANDAIRTANAQLLLRTQELKTAQAIEFQKLEDLNATLLRLRRSEELFSKGFLSAQALDNDRATSSSAKAALTAARSQSATASAAIELAHTQVAASFSAAAAARAMVDQIEATLRDSTIKAPKEGRVQYLIAQTGEVLGSGGRILVIADLSDVYMTFFVPEESAGKIALGTEVRIVVDAAPNIAIPARVSFISSVAQFTPRTVETSKEREKLMFRTRAQISKDLLQRHLSQVKTGVPGVAWVKLDERAAWPSHLSKTLD
jgi:HlyD family secretion protein